MTRLKPGRMVFLRPPLLKSMGWTASTPLICEVRDNRLVVFAAKPERLKRIERLKQRIRRQM